MSDKVEFCVLMVVTSSVSARGLHGHETETETRTQLRTKH